MNKIAKKIITGFGTLAGIIAPIAATVACGDEEKTSYIAFLKATDNSDYDETLFKYSEKYAKELDYGIDKFSSTNSITIEKRNVETIINTHKYKGIVFQPVDTVNSLKNLKLLLDAGINVTIPDRIFSQAQIEALTEKQSKRLITQITSDNKEIAKQAAKTMMDYWKKTKILSNDASVNDKTILLFEGEAASASSLERKQGFIEYFSTHSPILTPTIEIITADWDQAKAQTKFNTKIKTHTDAGIGLFAANDQMAKGILLSSAFSKLDGIEYPITTVDAHTWSEKFITYSAKTGIKRIIANYAQRTATTMRFATYSLIYSLNRDGWKGKKSIKGVLDKSIVFNLTPEQIYKSDEQTIKLSGVAITKDKDGNTINGASFV